MKRESHSISLAQLSYYVLTHRQPSYSVVARLSNLRGLPISFKSTVTDALEPGQHLDTCAMAFLIR